MTLAVLVLLLASGCAALKPGAQRLTDSQRTVLGDWRAFADTVTAEYHLDPVTIVLSPATAPSVEIAPSQNVITAPTGRLQESWFVIAHELGLIEQLSFIPV